MSVNRFDRTNTGGQGTCERFLSKNVCRSVHNECERRAHSKRLGSYDNNPVSDSGSNVMI